MKKWLCFLLLFTSTVFAAPNVVVSIKPIHDVTLAVMDGVTTPSLLVPSGASPHTYALAPSQANALYQADLIVWVGPNLETFLSQTIQSNQKAQILTVIDIPNMTLYPYRGKDKHDHGSTDPHLWLDPTNLAKYTSELAQILAKLDPEHAKVYETNAQRTLTALKTLDESLAEQLKPVEKVPLMVFHDAYQYFDKRYHLNVVGTILPRPDVLPSVAGVLAIQQRLKSEQVRCIFSEPQFKPAIVDRLVAQTGVRHGVLDPLGMPTPTGLPGTEALFKNLADSIVNCVN